MSPGADDELVSGNKVATVVAGLHLEDCIADIEGDRRQHVAGHDGALGQPDRLEGAGLGPGSIAGHHAGRGVRMGEEVDQRPTQCGEEVRHRRHVDEGDIAGHTAGGDRSGSSAHAATRRVNRGWSDSLPGSSVTARPMCSETTARASISAAFPDAATAAIASGWTKDSDPSSVSNAATSASNRGAGGRSRAAPGRQSHPVAEAPGQREGIDHSLVAEFENGVVQGPVDVGQEPGHVVAPEQLVGERPPPHEELVGKLAPQHPPVGHPLARLVLGKRVEGGDADRGEGEEVAVVPAVDDEGVAQLAPGIGERADRIWRRGVPGQGALGGHRRHRHNRRSFHPCAPPSGTTGWFRPTSWLRRARPDPPAEATQRWDRASDSSCGQRPRDRGIRVDRGRWPSVTRAVTDGRARCRPSVRSEADGSSADRGDGQWSTTGSDTASTGKVAIVAGASTDPGIGTATARRLAREGASVVINARRADRLEATARALVDEGLTVVGVAGSTGDDGVPAQLVATALERFGRIDHLVNAVGGAPFVGSALAMGRDDFLDTVALNTWPTLALIQEAMAHGSGRRRWLHRQYLERIAGQDDPGHGGLCGGQVSVECPHPHAGQRPGSPRRPGQRRQPGSDQDGRDPHDVGGRRRRRPPAPICSSAG